MTLDGITGVFGFFVGGCREIIDEKLIVPDRVSSLQLDGGIFEADILQLGFVFEEKPVGDIDL
jgi:hypothetical protein